MSRSRSFSCSGTCLETETQAEASGAVRRKKILVPESASVIKANSAGENVHRLDERLWNVDEFYSRKFYEFGNSNKLTKAVTKIVNISSDEALWFGVPLFGLFLNFLVVIPFNLGIRAIFDVNVVEFERSPATKFCLELFSTACLTVMVEQFFKCIFRRPRPKYLPKKMGPWSVYGEWWSFPSGHTIRGFYLYHWILHSRIIKDNASVELYHLWPLLFLWSASVGVARVTAGKHHLVDVFIGALIGYYLGHLIECDLSLPSLCAVKAVGELWISIQFWFVLIGPQLVKAKVNSKLINLVFYSFYAPINFLWAFHISTLYVDFNQK